MNFRANRSYLFGRATVGSAPVWSLACLAVLLCALVPDSMLADDWPTYRGDNARSGFQSSTLPTNLNLAWQFSPAQAPQPAWPPPARGSYWQELTYVAPRIVDDNTFHPIISGDAVLFASSADDSLYCLDEATGNLRWRVTTRGPIRYAPTVSAAKVYVGSDDGHAYCFDLENGGLLWQRRLAANDRIIPGNGRLISPWPIRTGIAVEGGIAYAAAGLYPSQGVFVYAMDAASGTVLWKSKIDYTAHGYLLLTDQYVVISTGRATPILVRRSDGVAVGQLKGAPGSYAVVAGEEVLSGRGNDGSLTAAGIDQQQSLVSFRAEQICASKEISYLLSKSQLTAIRLEDYVQYSRELSASKSQIEEMIAAKQAAEEAGLDAAEIKQLTIQIDEQAQKIGPLQRKRNDCRLWEISVSKAGCIAACTEFVAIGGENGVELRSPQNGSVLEKLPATGQVLGLAFSDRALVASTDAGQIRCFTAEPSSSRVADTSKTAPYEPTANVWDEKVRRLIDESVLPRFAGTHGYALVLGAGDAALIQSLVAQTDYTIVAVDVDAELIGALREQLIEAGLYGTRCAALRIPAGKLPFADYAFNLVVSASGQSDADVPNNDDSVWPRTEMGRVTRPFGGVAWLPPARPSQRGPLAGAGRWSHQYGNTANTADSGDQHLLRPLRLQWFGGPGPARMVDRHLRAPAPLVSEGRTFVTGENAIVCVDSFNGTEYWQLDAPDSQRYSMPYDCGYFSVHGDQFALAVRGDLWMVDTASGKVNHKLKVPHPEGQGDYHWGYVALTDDLIYGTRQLPTASRTEPSRQQIDVDYGNNQPNVTGQSIFAIQAGSQHPQWEFRSTILNPTITLADDVLYFVASQEQPMLDHPTGRVVLAEFLQHAPEVIALDAQSGEELWRQPLPLHLYNCKNILYLQKASNRLILSGSRVHAEDSWYRIATLDAETGETLWKTEHAKGRAREFTHGEQLHHPVVLGDVLVCEPVLYSLSTGERITPPGENDKWSIQRPGHSCGTMSGAGHCLLFRANNPTLLDLSAGPQGSERFFNISPTRPGCWINIVAADGLVLIPEASASCVCHYSLQTSMAFQAVPVDEAEDP